MGKKNMSRKIEIPAGVFEGNCSDCIYADRNDIDSFLKICIKLCLYSSRLCTNTLEEYLYRKN